MSAATATAPTNEEDLLEYSDNEEQTNQTQSTESNEQNNEDNGKPDEKYVAGLQTGFKDFLLKPELARAINDCGFEHPSEVQQATIPQSIHGTDVLCQAKSGLGKTAVFVLSTLQQIEPVDGEISVMVICHTRELAFQIKNEYTRFSKYMPEVRTGVYYGGVDVKANVKEFSDPKTTPHIVVATPGRAAKLVRDKKINLSKLKHFVIDECDKVLETLSMRRDVQDVFRQTPREKQTMMFTATLNEEIKPICRRFLQNPLEIFVDDQSKLTLHGLQQYYWKITEEEKNKKLAKILDDLDFNQVIIFVNTSKRAQELTKLLNISNFPAISVNGHMKQELRIATYQAFKNFEKRICVATDVFGRGIDIERINLAVNYDLPTEADQYLHRVGRAGRFGTKGLSISFVSSEKDEEVLKQIQDKFDVKMEAYPEETGIDSATYSNN
ncbi:hypothetical protein FOG51_01444 [Hanseniaspora uvarum]|uniref:RNA helicase n=1 Tax=Hanseniaspora uvarum TaxID=29833 RepID=A0A1E5RQD9_HANUV|nr:hypothetical protein FOG51_01444 [Hanseniaspora uvarum]KAF0277515.1 hypothetical protein FOG50_01670 [Hanseniaspora uvarum]OEJ89111.1 ATP-dependent RNA helicase SUB2-1 [Hanseniaspora uvarum]